MVREFYPTPRLVVGPIKKTLFLCASTLSMAFVWNFKCQHSGVSAGLPPKTPNFGPNIARIQDHRGGQVGGDKITLVVEDTRFVVNSAQFLLHPDTMLGKTARATDIEVK